MSEDNLAPAEETAGNDDPMALERARTADLADYTARFPESATRLPEAIRKGWTRKQFAHQHCEDYAEMQNDISNINPDVRAGGNIAVSYDRAGNRQYQRVDGGYSGEDPASVRELMTEALAHRINGNVKLSDAARQYRAFTAEAMARALDPNIRPGSRDWLSGTRGAYHTTSDFPLLLDNAANKALEASYQTAQSALKMVARRYVANDFKVQSRLRSGEFPSLFKVNDHGENKQGSMGENREEWQLETHSRMLSLTRQALVNDDLNAFGELIQKIGQAAANFEANELVRVLVANPAMSDGKGVFHADHMNLAASGGVFDVDTVGEARRAMRRQRGVDGAQIVNVTPRYLVVPAELETDADKFVASITAAQTSTVNPFSGKLEVLVDPRLDDDSTTAWYIAADPATMPTLGYGYLAGEEGVQTKMEEGFDVDGFRWLARIDFAAFFTDYRGMYKNPGA